ncbi:hypothetical protein EJ04DRAFT_529244 [Polyplosphaeria fusca]|uniref:C2H2-type domain-containing protein n=1 Tax=Polyplosphaeria fusca TaxID=682080 RepID=A0A9P4QI13_9PLEO|nr:hypothetical protein EJ04DRAFT_529244 [Polyplosphaeria fusca]
MRDRTRPNPDAQRNFECTVCKKAYARPDELEKHNSQYDHVHMVRRLAADAERVLLETRNTKSRGSKDARVVPMAKKFSGIAPGGATTTGGAGFTKAGFTKIAGTAKPVIKEDIAPEVEEEQANDSQVLNTEDVEMQDVDDVKPAEDLWEEYNPLEILAPTGTILPANFKLTVPKELHDYIEFYGQDVNGRLFQFQQAE